MLGASNNFVVRPFAFGFSSIVSGAIANPGGSASSGSGFIAAGGSFSYDVAAYRYAAGDDLNSDGVLDAGSDPTNNGVTPAFTAQTTLQVSSITPVGGTSGALSPSAIVAGDFSSGAASVQVATYAEAGSTILSATSLDYLGDTAADILGFSPEIGRFYPNDFELLLDDVTPGCSVGPTAFTYMGAGNLGVSYSLFARNTLGATTLNYDSALGYNTGLVGYHAENNGDGVDLSSRLSAASGTWTLGKYLLPSWATDYTDANALFPRSAVPDGPFSSLQLGLSVHTEPDSRLVGILNMNPGTTGDCTASSSCTSATIDAPVELRYGRVRVLNVFGPEIMALTVPVVTEYLNGSGFVINPDDGTGVSGCTQSPQVAVDLQTGTSLGSPVVVGAGTTTGTVSYVSGANFFLSSGDAGLVLSAPGVGNMGRVSVDIDLSTLPWLQFDWTGNGSYTDNPLQGSAIFGRFRGHDRVIYWSEQR